MHPMVLVALLAAVLLAAPPVEAGSGRLVIAESFPWRTRPAPPPDPHKHPIHGSGHQHPLHGQGHVHPLQGQGHAHPQHGQGRVQQPFQGGTHVHPQHRHPRVIVVPQPVYVVPPGNCRVPGYWTHEWVPQVTTYNVWVASHWSPEGTWIEGHYAPQTWSSGYWQQIWVPERWTC